MKQNELEYKIDKIGSLLDFTRDLIIFPHSDDIRNASLDLISYGIQNYFTALKLSIPLLDLNYSKCNLSEGIESYHLEKLNFNYHGFIKDAFFNSVFILVENHFRLIAKHYKIEEIDSINFLFKKLLYLSFFKSIDKNDREIFIFFCNLRNTMHNIGLQTKKTSTLSIDGRNSIFRKSVKLQLKTSEFNSINFDELVVLIEQTIRLVVKINNLIPDDTSIKHNLNNL